MNDQDTRIRAWHGLLFASPIDEAQDRLYKAFPAMRGFSSRQREEPLFQAILALALFQASSMTKDHPAHEVFVFVPTVTRQWFVGLMRENTKSIFGRLRNKQSVKLLEHVGLLFHQRRVGDQPGVLPNEPERWASFGFLKDDKGVPEWMGSKLLESSSRPAS